MKVGEKKLTSTRTMSVLVLGLLIFFSTATGNASA